MSRLILVIWQDIFSQDLAWIRFLRWHLWELEHNKTKVTWAFCEDSDQPGHQPSQGLHCMCDKAFCPWLPIRLGLCRQIDSSLVVHRSFLRLCHASARLLNIEIKNKYSIRFDIVSYKDMFISICFIKDYWKFHLFCISMKSIKLNWKKIE